VRFYRLTATEGGTLPPHEWLRIGAVIRVPRSNSTKPGAQWNPDEQAWVTPVWTEVADPRKEASADLASTIALHQNDTYRRAIREMAPTGGLVSIDDVLARLDGEAAS